MKYPPVVIVDEHDNEIGTATLAVAWQKGLYHRGSSVFIIDDRNRMLLQLRGSQVGIYPNRWDQAAGGHVDKGHSYEETAVQELAEELGIKNIPLTTLGTFVSKDRLDDARINNQFERVFLARVSHDIELKPEQSEISKLQWFTAAELAAEIEKNPGTFTPGLLYALRTYLPEFIQTKTV